MSTITYTDRTTQGVTVVLDGKYVGDIKKVGIGFAYYPKGKSFHGDVLPSMSAVQKTLEDPLDD